MEREQALKIIETLLYMTDHPLTEKEIVEVLEIKAYDEEAVRLMVSEIAQKYEVSGSPLQVIGVAGGVQVATRPDMAGWIRKLFKERLTVKLSPSALETLSIIAYKQPVTKADVERIRGVEASGVIDTLLERRLLKVVGRKEALGRPLLYGTTQEFLRQFGLKHLVDLPDISTLITTTPAQPELPGANVEAVPEETMPPPVASEFVDQDQSIASEEPTQTPNLPSPEESPQLAAVLSETTENGAFPAGIDNGDKENHA